MENEIKSFLYLNNVRKYEIEKIRGFKNLIKKNGHPCVVTIRDTKKGLFNLYVGISETIIVASSVIYDERTL